MVFASITFLYWFLPVVLLVYFILPKRGRNAWLLAASLFFYGWGEPRSLLLLAGSILTGYGCGIGIEKSGKRYKPLILGLAIAVEAGCLVFFKYADFFIENVNRITGVSIPLLKVVLPVGISFYTFQMISYLIDIYRGKVQAQRNLVDFAMYICLFTQLVAGPIVRYTDMEGQLKERGTSGEDILAGIRRMILGLSKKLLLADLLGEFCETVNNFSEPTVLALWLAAFAFAMQIYFDFSGYSDMAIGLGRLLGFRFPENFDYPYMAASVTEFWRRWHISLTQWFRDYLYIPLGGNRCKTWKWICNVMLVWLCTGLWHGAEWNFIIWGLYFALLLLLEKGIRHCGKNENSKEKLWTTIGKHGYVILVTVIGFVIFEGTDLVQLGQQLKGMFGFAGIALSSRETWYYMGSYGILFLTGILGCMPLGRYVVTKMKATGTGAKVLAVIEPLVLIGLLLISTAYLVDGTYHPFLYFRF